MVRYVLRCRRFIVDTATVMATVLCFASIIYHLTQVWRHVLYSADTFLTQAILQTE